MEVINRRTPNSKTYRNEDGSYSTQIHARDIHYYDGVGYKEIDLNIKRETNYEFEYALRDNRFNAYFNDSTGIENFTLAGFELINSNGVARWVNFKMLDAFPDSSGYYGNAFTYKNVQPNVDLEYAVTPEKLKENITVHDPSALQAFTFSIKLDAGLRFEAQEDNSVFFMDVETGEKLWEIASPFAVDAEGKRTDEVSYTFGKQSYEGVEYDSITVEVNDTSFLESAVYPIEIDPTVTIQPNDGKDAEIREQYPENNYGNDNLIQVGPSEGYEYVSLLEFDLTTIGSASSVSSADLSLYGASFPSGTGGTLNITAKRVTSDWLESSVTYNTKPAVDSSSVDTYAMARTSGMHTFSVLDVVNSIISSGSNYGLWLEGTGNMVGFWSSDASVEVGKKPKLTITYNAPPTKPDLITPNGGETWNTEHVIEWSASTDEEGDPITYEIQVSTDDGGNWSNVTTSATGTSHTYDFSPVPETSVARLRIRAYDGNSYSEWDESDGVFTIEHNDPPEAPTNLSPDGISVDRTEVQRLSWTHNDTDGQSKAEIDWKTQGTTTWNRVNVNSSDEYKDVNGGTFPASEIVWRVRTYDSYGEVSPWSNEIIFTAADPSNAPTITSPTDPVNVSRPTIEWTASDQQSYQIIIEDSLNTVVWDTLEVVSTNRARTSGIELNNGGVYDIRVRVRNEAGLWTDYAEITVNVSYTAPPDPELAIFSEQGSLRLDIVNPAPSGTEPTVTGNDLYKRSNGEWKKIAANLDDTYYDYAVASGKEYDYRITAHGDNGTTSQSLTRSGSTTFIGTWLHDVYDAQGTAHQFLVDGEGRSRTRTKDTQLVQFAGRKAPVAQSSKRRRAVVEGALLLRDTAEYEAFERIFESDIVCYRDGRGRLEYGVIIEEPIEDEFAGRYRVSYTLNRIDYSEVIE